MNHTAKSSGYFAGLRARGIPAMFTIFGIAALAVFGVIGAAAASGYDVAQPVGKMLGISMRSAAAPTAAHNGTLGGARVSSVPDGRIVVSMDVSGDFKGLVSIWVERGGSGSTITGGDWSLVHAYSQAVEAGPGESPGNSEGEAFVNKGTLGGNITGGSITFNADGSVASLSGLQLNLTSGSLDYQGVTGDGTAQVSNVSDQPNSSGTITLNF